MNNDTRGAMGTLGSSNSAKSPDRFYKRFAPDGKVCDKDLPCITSTETEELFPVRDNGLFVLMINPPIREWSYPNIMPLGQGYVCSVMAMDGHRVKTLDLNAMRKKPTRDDPEKFSKWVDEKVIERLTKEKPDVIGIGGIITQYGRIKQITSICKKVYPDVPIIMGGGIASCLPEFMVERLPIDAALTKEGEIVTSEFLHRIETGGSWEGIEGLVYRHKTTNGHWEVRSNKARISIGPREQGLDSLPWPLRSRFAIDDIYKRNPVGHLNWKTKWINGASVENKNSVAMIASRGCPYAVKACDYCYAAYLGANYRLRSPKEIVDEMQYISQRYDAEYIHFLDDLLMTDYRWAIELCSELRSRKEQDGFAVTWGATCRTNIIADDVIRAKKAGRPNILELSYEVGMRQAGYGVETASPTILKSIDKSGQTVEKIKIAILETKRVLGYADCSFMIGSPGETRETVKETVDVCNEIGLKPEVFFFTTAYPATSFWDLALDKGLIAKAVTGKKGPADDDIIEQYFLRLGEQGEEVRTNFSDLPDEEIAELSWWAVNQSGAQNTVRHPHLIEEKDSKKPNKKAIYGASMADL